MGLFNNSDTEKKFQAIELILEKLVDATTSQEQVNKMQAVLNDCDDKKIAQLKSAIDILIENNRKLTEMVIKNDERYIETLASIEKLNGKFQELLAGRTKLN